MLEGGRDVTEARQKPTDTADRREITIRGVVLGSLITLVFTAANVYLGLRVGLTFASSIPAAVISMALLRPLKNATIHENNIVQTIASAAGTLSSIIFVLPGLVMVGWWTGFPFWESFGVCAIGGILGVMYTVPLRRALVTDSELPYPEGVAAAEILRVGHERADENRAGLLTVIVGAIVSAFYVFVEATGIFASEIARYVRVGASATGLGAGVSFALVGAGHLVGLGVGIAMFVGVAIAWGVAVPLLTALHATPGDPAAVAVSVWAHQVRFIGAGAIGIAGIWTLGKLARPVWLGIASAIAVSRGLFRGADASLPRTERDLPIGVVALVSLAILLPLAALLDAFLSGTALAPYAVALVVGAVAYVALAGFLVSAACGYMAGLIGSSNSPVSGLAILTVLGAALLLGITAHGMGPSAAPALVAFALFVTAVVLCVATIANDNLQDLKTGQLVDATPWRQQIALVIGVVVGAAIIPPILDLLNRAYGFAGSPLHGAAGSHPLPAPQATLISALAVGVVGGKLDWGLIGVGAVVGAVIIIVDELLGTTKRYSLPPLAVGLGIYLPSASIVPIVVGAILGYGYDRACAKRKDPEGAKRLGVLLASGLIVGESLFGVALAALIVVSGKASPLAVVGDAFAPVANTVATLAFVSGVAALYAWLGRLAKKTV